MIDRFNCTEICMGCKAEVHACECDDAMDLLDWEVLKRDNYVVLDFEIDTSGGHGGQAAFSENQLLLACWKTAGSPVYAKWGNEFEQEELCQAIANAGYVIAHQAAYELGWLKRCGVDILNLPVACTLLAEHVLLGNLGCGDKYNLPKGLSLNACVTRRGGIPKDPAADLLISHGINPVRIPRKWLKQRCMKDVADTEQLWLDQRKHLLASRRLPVLWTRTILTPVLADIMPTGMTLDADRVRSTHEQYKKDYAALEAEMSTLTGGVNWQSPKQVADFLYGETNEGAKARIEAALGQALKCQFGRAKKWPEARDFEPRRKGLDFEPLGNRDGTPNRSTDKDVLAKLVPRNKRQTEFLALRKKIGKVGFAISKSLNFFRGVVEEKGGTFVAELHQSRVATHRLSSTGCPLAFEMYDGETASAQFQNLPRAFKPLFKAPKPGWLIGEWDGSQLEFRAAGHLSRDPQIRADVVAGHDVHRFTGAVIYHAPKEWLKNIERYVPEIQELMPLVTKEQRQVSKPHTFKPVYGGQSGTEREQAYYAAFRARYHKLAQTQAEWAYEVLGTRDHSLTTEYGMKYFWPTVSQRRDGYIPQSTSIYNYPVQGFATAEIIPIAVSWFARQVKDTEGIKILNTVHDSVICAVREDHVAIFKQLSLDVWSFVYSYLKEVYGIEEMFVPLGTEVALGTHWGEPSDVHAFTIWPDGRIQEAA